MNSQKFIEKHQEMWAKLQQILDTIEKKGVVRLSREDLRVLGPLFRRVAANLSYAQTNFPESDVVLYLNRLVARAHSHLYRTETVSLRSIVYFYLQGFPLLICMYRKYVMAAAIILLAGMGWGWWLNHLQSPMANAAVPVAIRDAVNRNIQDNQVGVVLGSTEKPLFSGLIMVNNIWVSLYCLVLGVTWGVGTVFILLRNGLMLGVLADIFAGHHLSLKFWSLILPHGILELFAIVLNGGAGLLIASALVKPGELKRKDALVIKGKPAVLLAMGSIPILIIAAIIEGFITPLKIPAWSKLLFAGFTAAALLLYVYMGLREVRDND